MRVSVFCLLFLGCGGRVLEAESAPDAMPSVDATAPVDSGSAPESLAECFGEIGKSHPATVKDLRYVWADCGSADFCTNYFLFDVGCAMEMRREEGSPVLHATASETDCILLERWATSERLLGALDASSAEAKACMSRPGAFSESTIIGGTPYVMTTGFCDVEPFSTHRKCLRMVMKKYFPVK